MGLGMKPKAAQGKFPYPHGPLDGNWLKKHPNAEVDRVNKLAERGYVVDLQKATNLLDGLIAESMATDEKGMTLAQRNAFRSKLEALREKLKILGSLLAKEKNKLSMESLQRTYSMDLSMLVS